MFDVRYSDIQEFMIREQALKNWVVLRSYIASIEPESNSNEYLYGVYEFKKAVLEKMSELEKQKGYDMEEKPFQR